MSDTKKSTASKKDKPDHKLFYVEFAEKIIERLKAGTAPWQQPWHPGSVTLAPHNPVSGTVYKGMNRINLGLCPGMTIRAG
jgi:antirestriction protein ArdC